MFKVFKIGVKKTGKQIDLLIGKFFNKYVALYITIVGFLVPMIITLPFNSNNRPLTGNAEEQYNLETKKHPEADGEIEQKKKDFDEDKTPRYEKRINIRNQTQTQ